MQASLGKQTIVLLGIGHTNAHVLRMWKMKPLESTQLVCVSNFPKVTYSGMMPGVLSAQYNQSLMEIDLVRLCSSAGARLILDPVVGIDHSRKALLFANRPPLPFDVMSIGIGSRPTFAGVEVHDDSALIAIKPMQTFLDRLTARLGSQADQKQLRIAIVGGGLGSIEVACCLDQRIQDAPESLGCHGRQRVEFCLITASEQTGEGLNEQAQNSVQKVLDRRQIKIFNGVRVASIDGQQLTFNDGQQVQADVIIWATGAAPPELLTKLGLETDQRGFLKTHPTLQSVTDDRVFAVGDTGAIDGYQLPKAGVYAVRQGPVLWNNLRRRLWDRPLLYYRPQPKFLKLINTADGKAVGEYGSQSFYNRAAWWLKDYIDRKFMRMYHDYAPMEMRPSAGTQAEAMRCLGCGGKLGSRMLSSVLNELELPPHEDVILGLDQPDDAAIIRTDQQVTVTTDFFASPLEDPYLAGRVALLNAASDLFVMGAQPTAALAMAQVPLGHPRAQRQVLHELMAGCVEELSRIPAALVGGHSIEGPRLTIGFTVLGKQLRPPATKGGLTVGDHLVLSKPLGSGIALAALMQSRLSGEAYQQLVEVMTQSNQIALELASTFDLQAMTDVTGFGLAGHLAEMLRASRCSANLELGSIPRLPEVDQLVSEGIESTLAPDNRQALGGVAMHLGAYSEQDTAVLFDPQTNGGLLLAVKPERSDAVLERLHESGFVRASVIGEVVAGRETDTITLK